VIKFIKAVKCSLLYNFLLSNFQLLS
jgi:hypothetical protein